MKKTTSLILLLFMASAVLAQARPEDNIDFGTHARNSGNDDRRYSNASGTVIVNTTTYRPFTVLLNNNQSYQSNRSDFGYGNDVRIDNIYTGSHKIDVYEWKKNVFGNTKRYLLYSGNIYVKQGVEVTVQLNGYGQPVITERQMYNRNNNDRDNRWNKKRKGKRNNHCGDDRGYRDNDRSYRDNDRRYNDDNR